MLSPAQISTFHERGLIKLPGFYTGGMIAPMRTAVWRFLEKREGIQQSAPDTWPAQQPGTRPAKLTKLNMNAVFDPLLGPKLQEVLGALAPGQTATPFPGTGHRQTLISFPDSDQWHLPHAMWHTDLPHQAGRTSPQGLQTFICMDEVAPQGGGTLVLAGSHRADVGGQGQIPSAQFKKLLGEQSDYAATLFDKNTPNRNDLLAQPGSFKGVELQPIELTGQAGDLYIMDMRCLHTLSPNVLNKPRLVVTQRFEVTP